METKALIFRTWDDLVFAYRNKEYGAYSIRRAYARRVVLGWGISVAIVTLLLFVPGIISRFKKKAEVPLITCDFTAITLSDYVPPIREKKAPKQQQPATQRCCLSNSIFPIIDFTNSRLVESSTGLVV